MSQDREPNEPNAGGPNPMVKSLMIWGGIFLALLLVVSMFGSGGQTAGTQIGYSDFRQRVAQGALPPPQAPRGRTTRRKRAG